MKRYLIFLREVFLAAPLYVIGFFAASVLEVLPSYICTVWFLKEIIDRITAGCGMGELFPLFGMITVYLLLSDGYLAWFGNIFQPTARDGLDRCFRKKLWDAYSRKELYLYDIPEFHDEAEYLNSRMGSVLESVLISVAQICAGGITILLTLHLLRDTGPLLLLIALCAVAAAVTADRQAADCQNRKNRELVRWERRRKYLTGIFFAPSPFKERKTSRAETVIRREHERACREAGDTLKRFGRKTTCLRFIRNFVSSTLCMNFLLILWLAYEVKVAKSLSLGGFAAGYNGVSTITGSVMTFLSCLDRVREDRFFIGRWETFSKAGQGHPSEDQKESCGRQSPPDIISLKNVSFTYPGTDREVLHDISLDIRRGEKIAVVGPNGSGKTTLVHLLMGLYRPDAGEILVDGKLLRDEDRDAYARSFCAFFQGQRLLPASIGENIALDVTVDERRASAALKRMGILPQKDLSLSAMVDRELYEDGLILSGGEEARLMLAHCLYDSDQVTVLDEPSAALDPVAQRQLNADIFREMKNRTVLFISHRLQTVSMAERICVMEAGRIVESGTHSELLKQDGLYRRMWMLQAAKYGETETQDAGGFP